jgi:hypothetical protein
MKSKYPQNMKAKKRKPHSKQEKQESHSDEGRIQIQLFFWKKNSSFLIPEVCFKGNEKVFQAVKV